jgi:putative two-component system hydrogenase maturation factor HypX/HoxX
MRVMLLASAFNSLTQRVHTELREAGHIVSVEVAHGDDDALRTAISRFRPDVILAPMLTKVVPEDVWSQHPVLIVHPGPMGDRGPSSLDWARSAWPITLASSWTYAANRDSPPSMACVMAASRSTQPNSLISNQAAARNATF